MRPFEHSPLSLDQQCADPCYHLLEVVPGHGHLFKLIEFLLQLVFLATVCCQFFDDVSLLLEHFVLVEV